jgi:hypothetical protein
LPLTNTGTSRCPPVSNLGQTNCSTDLRWVSVLPDCTAKFTITRRLATTVYDYRNQSILGLTNLTDPTPTNYTAIDFIDIFEVVLTLPSGALEQDTVVGTFLNIMYNQISAPPASSTEVCWAQQAGGTSSLSGLFQAIALPITLIGVDPETIPADNQYITASFARPYFRVSAFVLDCC